MILLDTHTWVWWLLAPQRLSQQASVCIEKAEQDDAIGVAVISCWELAMLVAKNRVGLSVDVEQWIARSFDIPGVHLVEFTPTIAVLATRLEAGAPNDPVDRMLIATAKVHGCPLVTRDERIRAYPQVATIW